MATLVRYTGLAERTVRTCLDRLAGSGVISPCDPDIVAARIKRADRRPQGWDLNLALVRGDLDDATIGALERQFPGLSGRIAAAAQPVADGPSDGVQPAHPVATGTEPVDNRAGCSRCTARPDRGAASTPTGCNRRSHGVAAVAPEPYREPSTEPAAPAPARDAPPTATAGGGGGPTGEFFTALGAAWRLTAAHRARLAPAVIAALDAGWTPPALAAFAGANTAGVRNPYAVLVTRLSAAELPPLHTRRPSRPPWCGECDQTTPMLGFDGDAPRPCPRCKRRAASPTQPSTSRNDPHPHVMPDTDTAVVGRVRVHQHSPADTKTARS